MISYKVFNVGKPEFHILWPCWSPAPAQMRKAQRAPYYAYVRTTWQVSKHIQVPFRLTHFARYRSTYQVGQKPEKFGKNGNVKWDRKYFFSKSTYIIGPLQGYRGRRSRISRSHALKMLTKLFCNITNGKICHFVYILKNRLFTLTIQLKYYCRI